MLHSFGRFLFAFLDGNQDLVVRPSLALLIPCLTGAVGKQADTACAADPVVG